MLAAIGHALMMSHLSTYTGSMRLALCLLFTLTALSAQAQESLGHQIRAIAIEAHGKVSLACSSLVLQLQIRLD